MLRVFIGYDNRERIAYHVLSHSILKRSSIPTSITPLNKDCLRGFFSRPRGPLESTDFSISRFLVPFLCDYEGYAVFMDCDMLCQGDIAELAGYMSLMFHYNTAVRVVKHEYQPTEKTKFLGNIQTQYEKKNWSSVMLFNNTLCRNLTPEYVDKAHGLDLHQFKWIKEHQIGGLPKAWNWLIDEPGYEGAEAKLLHFTKGTPCFDDYANCTGADLWHREREDMLSHG
jgi:hypothetical protein